MNKKVNIVGSAKAKKYFVLALNEMSRNISSRHFTVLLNYFERFCKKTPVFSWNCADHIFEVCKVKP